MSKVCVLEDNADLRRVMREIFTILGATGCLTLSSVAELQANADEALRSDLSILDVNLGPGMPTGIDAYNWLLSEGYRGRIVFLTGHAFSHPLVVAATRLPGVIVLEKPLGIDAFAKLLEPKV